MSAKHTPGLTFCEACKGDKLKEHPATGPYPCRACLGSGISARSLTLWFERTKDHSLFLSIPGSMVQVARVLGASIPKSGVPAEHYAARIVACVNACEGIEAPAAVLALVRTLAGLSFPHELSGDDDSIEALTSLIRQARKISRAAAPMTVREAHAIVEPQMRAEQADLGPHSGDGALAVQEVHEAQSARCTGQHPNCLGCDCLRRKAEIEKKGSCT